MHLKKELSLPQSGLVLEIGGGGNPHPRSDVLVDRFLNDEGFAQRGRAPLVVGDRLLICAHGALMPFLDHQFEYVILSHVIEHVPAESVHQFVAELQRVALAGYIEAPSILYEAIRNIPEHIWYVVCEPGVVHLCKKTSVSRWQPFLDPLFDDGDFQLVVEKYVALFFTGAEWSSDGVRLEIHQNMGELIDLYPTDWARELILSELVRAKQASHSVSRYTEWIIPPLFPKVAGSLSHRFKNIVQRLTIAKRATD